MGKAKSILKKMLKISAWMVLTFVFLFLLLAGLIQIPYVQNKVVSYATEFISNKTHSKVEIQYINLSFPKSIFIEGFYLEDLNKDTLIYAGSLTVDIDFLELASNQINISSIELDNLNLNLYNSKTDAKFNYNFLITAFADTSAVDSCTLQNSKLWTFNIENIELKKNRIRYDDAFGGSYINLSIENLKLNLDKLDILKADYKIDKLLVDGLIANIKLKEASAEPTPNSNETSELILPKLSANRIQLKNSVINFGDFINKQAVSAKINDFQLNTTAIDLQNQIVNLQEISLANSNIQYRFQNVATATDSSEITTANASNNWQVNVNKIAFENNALSYRNTEKPQITSFDVDNLQFSKLNLKAEDLVYSQSKTAILLKELNAVDQNGFEINHFQTDFSMDTHSINLNKFLANTKNSSINASLNLQFESLASLMDSLPFLKVDLNVENSSISNADILYFSPELYKIDFFKQKNTANTLSGSIKGSVNDLQAHNIVFATGNKTTLTSDFQIKGLPNIETAHYNFPKLKLVTGRTDIEMLAGSMLPQSIHLPENIEANLNFKGKLKAFDAIVGTNTSFGNGLLTAHLDTKENFKGNFALNSFDLGQLLNDSEMYGPLSFTANVIGNGLDTKSMKATINAEIQDIYINNYSYKKLNIKGDVADQQFDGKININDENIKFNFDGLLTFIPNKERFKFNFKMHGIDLAKLNFSQDDLRMSFDMQADLNGASMDNMNGTANIANIIIAQNKNKYRLDSVLFVTKNQADKSEFSLQSDLIDFKYKGNITPDKLPEVLSQFANNYFPFVADNQSKSPNSNANFNFDIQLHNHPILSEVFLPDLKAFEPGAITGTYKNNSKELKLAGTINKIIYGSTEINKLDLAISSDTSKMNYQLNCANITNSLIDIKNLLFKGIVSNNEIQSQLSIIDGLKTKLLVGTKMSQEKNQMKLIVDPKNLIIMNHAWNIANDNYIAFAKNGYNIHNMFISNRESEFNVSSANNKFNDDIDIIFKQFRLQDISRIFEKDSSLLQGSLNGNVLLKNTKTGFGIVANADIQELIFQKIQIGNLALKAKNLENNVFDINLKLSGNNNDVSASGYFNPNGGENSININTIVKSLSMKTIEAFSLGELTESSGNVNGNISLSGDANAPQLGGEIWFNNAFTKPSYLNNRIELKHENITLKPDGIYFNKLTMLDSNKNKAIIDGAVHMKQFSDFVLALHVTSSDFMLFNTTANDNSDFYGRMIIDSNIDIKGPLTLPVINAHLKMKNGSNFTFVVPEDELNAYKGDDVVVFEKPTSTNEIINRNNNNNATANSNTNFDLSSVIEVDKDATLRLFMDPASSDSLVVKGEAALSFNMDRSGKISLTGTYNLQEGSYDISLQEVIRKKFGILPGSTITWNGDPMDADIAINTTYTVRTAPYDLVADQMTTLSDGEKASYKQQYPFLVLLKLRGAILKPEISFEIQLLPENKGIFGGAVNQKLNLLNEDPSALNKQVFALLVLGRFVQENPLQTESAGTESLIRSTVSNFLSSELNKLSSKLIPGVEMNFDIQSFEDYESGNAQGRTQVGIGLKKQLFNDRLTVKVGGNVDVEGEKAKENSVANIAGDVTIEYSLTKDGKFKLKGFRQSKYEGAIDGELIETGIGIMYVKDFNKWKAGKSSLIKK